MVSSTCDQVPAWSWAYGFEGRCYFYPRRDCPGYLPGHKCGRIGREIPEMALYRITIEKSEVVEGKMGEWHKAVVIEASTQYTLAEDLPEWVQEEIDPGAEVTTYQVSEGSGDDGGTDED